VDVVALHHCLPRRFDPHEPAFVGPGSPVSSDHHVAFGDQLFDRTRDIRNRGSKSRDVLLDPFRAANGLGECRIVLDIVVCKEFIDEVQVALANDLIRVCEGELLVFGFRRCRASRRLDGADLQERPEQVGKAGHFDQFSVVEPVASKPSNLDRGSGRFDTHQFAFVGTTERAIRHHRVALGDDIVCFEG